MCFTDHAVDASDPRMAQVACICPDELEACRFAQLSIVILVAVRMVMGVIAKFVSGLFGLFRSISIC